MVYGLTDGKTTAQTIQIQTFSGGDWMPKSLLLLFLNRFALS
jgi:hypothetical protein